MESTNQKSPEILEDSPLENLPPKGARRFIRILGANFWELIKLNFLFTLFCLPVVTIPAACTAMSYVCYKMVSVQPYQTWTDFWNRFRSEFMRSLAVGLLYGLTLGALVYLLVFYKGVLFFQAGLTGYAVSALLVIGIFFFFQASVYSFALLGIVHLPLAAVLSNSFRLVIVRPLAEIISFLFFAALTTIMVLTFPFTVPLIFFLYFGPVCFVCIYAARPGIQMCLIS